MMGDCKEVLTGKEIDDYLFSEIYNEGKEKDENTDRYIEVIKKMLFEDIISNLLHKCLNSGQLTLLKEDVDSFLIMYQEM